MGGETLLHVLDDGVDITKGNPFFRRQFELPANALFGEESRPAALPHWVAAWSRARYRSPAQTAADRSIHAGGQAAAPE